MKEKKGKKSSFIGTNSDEVKNIILQYKQNHEKQILRSMSK